MQTSSPEVRKVDSSVRARLRGRRVVLAISGGLDSMCLLEACRRAFPVDGPSDAILVGTFDHGTGMFARKAAQLVASRAAELGFQCVIGRARNKGLREHEWRDERWRFLRGVAGSESRVVVTAHTLDDQIETVFMRVLREAGPRGLAGLFAESDIVRPFLTISRVHLAAYASSLGVRHIEDPTNDARTHLRNRVRHDLLPALRKVQPDLDSELLRIARESAEWRRRMDDLVSSITEEQPDHGELRVARECLSGYDADSLRVIWPTLAARASVVMDRRGTHRAAEFTIKGSTGGSIQLSGGVEILMRRDHMLLRRWRSPSGARA